MTETIPTRPFDEMEALAWLRSQPEGAVTASAAELGRRWGWNRMRTGRRLKAWEKAGLIRRRSDHCNCVCYIDRYRCYGDCCRGSQRHAHA
jgi:MarR family